MPSCRPGAWKQKAAVQVAERQRENGNTNPLKETRWRCLSLALRRPGYLSTGLLATVPFSPGSSVEGGRQVQPLLQAPSRPALAALQYGSA